MAIHYPSSLKGMTSGALRQLKQNGSTTASGGFFDVETIKHLAVTNLRTLLNRREPAGQFMNTLEQAARSVDELQQAILASTRNLVVTAESAAKEVHSASGKMRDSTDKLSAAMRKFSETAGTKSFADAAVQTQSMVDALERLAALQQNGLLEKVLAAMATSNKGK